jgi:aspartate beta-hydroxylase
MGSESDNRAMEDATQPLTLDDARAYALRGEVLRAEALCARLLRADPGNLDVRTQLAQWALERDDIERAVSLLAGAHRDFPADLRIAMRLAQILWGAGDLPSAQQVFETTLARTPAPGDDLPLAWLLLGELRRLQGQDAGAAKAWHQAVSRSRTHPEWQDEAQLAPPMHGLLQRARTSAREARRAHLLRAGDAIRARFGASAIERIDAAILAMTDEMPALPEDPRQRPKFFYVPGLPSQPYLDPALVPWTPRLRAAFRDVRDEALSLLRSGEQLTGFIDFDARGRMDEYLGGRSEKPAWDALFFYRRGERYDDNHRRFPKTSALLDSIDLFRMQGQAPEICFSFLAPQTTIMPHYGVSNVRLVMHLPLLVPTDCALHLVGAGEHRWVEGEPVLFDDTYLHESWNRSDQVRIILLMDCWNPHLTLPERAAVVDTIAAIRDFEYAL